MCVLESGAKGKALGNHVPQPNGAVTSRIGRAAWSGLPRIPDSASRQKMLYEGSRYTATPDEDSALKVAFEPIPR